MSPAPVPSAEHKLAATALWLVPSPELSHMMPSEHCPQSLVPESPTDYQCPRVTRKREGKGDKKTITKNSADFPMTTPAGDSRADGSTKTFLKQAGRSAATERGTQGMLNGVRYLPGTMPHQAQFKFWHHLGPQNTTKSDPWVPSQEQALSTGRYSLTNPHVPPPPNKITP